MHHVLNHQPVTVPDDLVDEPLLFVLRDHFGLNGPRFGCGVGSCGACTVVIDGAAERSCLRSAGTMNGRTVVRLEGLAIGGKLHPLQESWIAESVPQCGYCQNGQIMTAHALLARTPSMTAPSEIFGDHLKRVDGFALLVIQRAERLVEAVVEMILDQCPLCVFTALPSPPHEAVGRC